MALTDELKGMTEIALFAGAGGGVLGTKMIGLRTVAYVEWDEYPQRILKARMADGLIETAPVFGDVREFDPVPYAGKVDVVSGGFPCQPFSTAGRQEADFDPRNMWPATRDIVRGVRPKYAFLENVSGLLTGTHGYFGVVLGELAASGYDVTWTCLPAAAVGAPHRRDRLWILGRRREGGSTIVPDQTLVEFARFDQATLAWHRFDGRCRGDTASKVTTYIPFPRSGAVAVASDGTTVVYALDPVALADGSTRGGWPWPRILEDLRIQDPVGPRRDHDNLGHLAADWCGHGGQTFPTPLAGNATPGEGGNHGGMALRAAAAEGDAQHARTWATPTAGISKEVVTPGMAARVDRRNNVGNLLEDVAHSLYGEGSEPPATAWPTPTTRGLNGGSGVVDQITNLVAAGGVDADEVAVMLGRTPGTGSVPDPVEGESASWPTPMASRNRKSIRAMMDPKTGYPRAQGSPPGLEQAVELAAGVIPRELVGVDPNDLPPATRAMWPTPQATNVSNDVTVRTASQRSADSPPNKLGWAVGEAEDNQATWPTPTATDWKGPSQPEGRRPIGDDDLPSRVARAGGADEEGVSTRNWPTPVTGGLTPGGGVYQTRRALVEDGRGTETEISAMFHLRPRREGDALKIGDADRQDPVEPIPADAELDLDALTDLAERMQGEPVKWHLVSPSYAVRGGQFPTPAACDSFCNNVDGFSPLGRFIQNDNKRPPRRSKEERDAARATRTGPTPQLNPDWVEWLMGWPIGWTSMSPMSRDETETYATTMPGPWWRREPTHIPRITVGTPDRAFRLKACGNGQVALCAAASFEILLETFRQIEIACAHGAPGEVDAADFLGL